MDLCLCRTKAHVLVEDGRRVLPLEPVEIVFSGLTVKLQTVLTFEEGSGSIQTQRKVLEMSDPKAEVTINEYMTGCYGTTEYPEDMSSLKLSGEKDGSKTELSYEYKCREFTIPGADKVSCLIPPVGTNVVLACEGTEKEGYVREGYAFSPMYTLGYTGKLREKEVFTTWLRLEKAD